MVIQGKFSKTTKITV